jgi:hypothetical protein
LGRNVDCAVEALHAAVLEIMQGVIEDYHSIGAPESE